MLSALFGLLTLSTGAAALCAGSDIDGIRKCYTPYVKKFGFDMTDGLPAYWEMHGARKALLFDQGLRAQPAVTMVGRNLVSCMKSYWDCVDTDTYVNGLGQNATDGLDWLTDLGVTEFEVSPRGSYLQLRHFFGIQVCGTTPYVGIGIGACAAAFALEMDLGNKDACNNHLKCLFDAVKGCLGPEGGEYMCGTQRGGLSITYKATPDVCKMGPCPNTPEY